MKICKWMVGIKTTQSQWMNMLLLGRNVGAASFECGDALMLLRYALMYMCVKYGLEFELWPNDIPTIKLRASCNVAGKNIDQRVRESELNVFHFAESLLEWISIRSNRAKMARQWDKWRNTTCLGFGANLWHSLLSLSFFLSFFQLYLFNYKFVTKTCYIKSTHTPYKISDNWTSDAKSASRADTQSTTKPIKNTEWTKKKNWTKHLKQRTYKMQ